MADQGASTAVGFDHAAAQDAAAACERAARVLRDATLRRASLARTALVNGRGPWRDDLVRRGAALDAQATEIEARLRALARDLAAASAQAKPSLDVGHLRTASVPR